MNFSQLRQVETASGNTDQRAVKYDWTDANTNGVIDEGELNLDSVTLAGGMGRTRISNLAPGALSAASTDAVTAASSSGFAAAYPTWPSPWAGEPPMTLSRMSGSPRNTRSAAPTTAMSATRWRRWAARPVPAGASRRRVRTRPMSRRARRWIFAAATAISSSARRRPATP
ncbi:hypothetical protein [Sinorhizobium meliloti]|uniref:hypothetical protein n=1 Tax=Rhizobium meliloti TaxID=382 RepID=UPI003D662026